MNSRDRVIHAIQHKSVERIPLDGWFTTNVMDELKKEFGVVTTEEVQEQLGIDFRSVVLDPAPEFRKSAQELTFMLDFETFAIADCIQRPIGENLFEDEWGIQIKLNDDGVNWGYVYHPLSDLTFDNFKIPNLDESGRLDRAKEKIKSWNNQFVLATVSTVFRRGWLLTGFSNFLTALMLNRDFIEKLLDRLFEYNLQETDMLAEIGVNMIQLLGDLGAESSLFLSPDLWRELFKPRMAKLISAIKQKYPDVYFFLHSDGKIDDIIPDLIEIGLDVLNPIQPECMDVKSIANQYGTDLTLHGTISLQKTLAFGTPEDVIEEAQSRIEIFGNNGGLILAPSNALTHDIPSANIISLYEYVKNNIL